MATSSSNQLVEEINEQFLVCKICYDVYKKPKTLSCLHTFCTECLEKHQDAELERSYRYLLYSRAVTCPICRKKTEVPPGGIKRLPDNFLVSNLADIINRRKPSQTGQACEICRPADHGTNSRAVSKCLDCCKFLCRPCLELHKRTKVTQAHALYDIEVEKDIECKKHQDEVVRFYCEPCEVCVCVVCTFQEHKGHDVSSFTEGIEKYRHSLDNLLVKCRGRIQQLRDQLHLITKCETDIKNTEDQITEVAIESISAIRKREQEMVRDLYLAYGEESIDFIKEKEFIEESIDSLQSTCNLTDIILKDESIELLLLKKEIQEKLNLLLQRKWICPPDIVSEQVQFIPAKPELGYLQIGDSLKQCDNEEKGVSRKFSKPGPVRPGLSVDTQTDLVNKHEMSTSMIQVSSNEQLTQTDFVARKETGTLTSPGRGKPIMHTKCTLAVPDVRDSQTMTINTPTMKRKTQTETVSQTDQHTSTSKFQLSSASISINTQTMNTTERGTMTKMCKYNSQMTSTEELIFTKNHETLTDVVTTRSSSTETSPLDTLNKGTLTTKAFSADKKTSTPLKTLNTQETNTPLVQTLDMGVTARFEGQDIGVTTRTIVTTSIATGDNNVMTSDVGMHASCQQEVTPTAEKHTSYDIKGNDMCSMTDMREVQDQVTFTNYFNMVDSSTATDQKQYQSTYTSTAQLKMKESNTNTEPVHMADKMVHVETLREVEKVDTLDEICQTMISIIDAVLWPSMMPVTTATNTEPTQSTDQGTSMSCTSFSETGVNTLRYDVADMGIGDSLWMAHDMACNTAHTVAGTGDMSVATEPVSTQEQGNSTDHIHTLDAAMGTETLLTRDSSHDAFRGHLRDADTNTDVDMVVKPSVVVCDVSTSTHVVEMRNAGTNILIDTQESSTGTIAAMYSSCSTSTDPLQQSDADTTMGSCVSVYNQFVNTTHIQLTDTGCGTPFIHLADASILTEHPGVTSQSTGTDQHLMVTKETETVSILTSDVGMLTHPDVSTTGSDAVEYHTRHQETYMEPVYHATVGVGTIDAKSVSKGVCTDPPQTKESGTYTYVQNVEKATYMPQPITITTGTATQQVITKDKTSATECTELFDSSTNTTAPKLITTETTMFSEVMTKDRNINTDTVTMVDSPNDPIHMPTENTSTNTPHVEFRSVDTCTPEVVTLSMGTTTHHRVACVEQDTSTVSMETCDQMTSTVQVKQCDKASSIRPEARSIGLLKRPHTITRGAGTVRVKLCTTSTSPHQPYIEDRGTMTVPIRVVSKSISCKPFCLVDQSTGTRRVDHAETFTEMPPVIYNNRACSPHNQVDYNDRSSSPIMILEFCERETSPVNWPVTHQGTTVKPHTHESHTSTAHIDLRCQETDMPRVEFTDRACSPVDFLPEITTVHRSTSMPQMLMRNQFCLAQPESNTTGVNTTPPAQTDRASTPVRLSATDQGINAVVVMATKEAYTPHIVTVEQGTSLRRPRTKQSATSMPHISFLEKETSMPQVHTMHKNISTDNMNMVDKHTSTMIDITAAYRDTVAASRPLSITRGTAMEHKIMISKETSPPRLTTIVERASSPVKTIMVDKAVLANKGEIMEPVDTYQAPGEAPKKARKARQRPRLASIEEDSTESSMESLDEEPVFSMSPLLYPPRSPRLPRMSSTSTSHKERLWPSTPRMGKSAVSAFNYESRTLPSSIVCKVEMGTNTGRVRLTTRGTSTGMPCTSEKGVSTDTLPVETKMAECISKLKTVRNRLEQKQSDKPESPTIVEHGFGIVRDTPSPVGIIRIPSITTKGVDTNEDISKKPSLAIGMRSKSVGDNLNDNELVPLANQVMLSTSGSSDGSSGGDFDDRGLSPRLKARKQRLDINQLLRSSSLPERDNPPPPVTLPKPNIQTVHPQIIPKINLEDFKGKPTSTSKKPANRPAISPTFSQSSKKSTTRSVAISPTPSQQERVQSPTRNRVLAQSPTRNRASVQSPTRNRKAVSSPTRNKPSVPSPTRHQSVPSPPTIPIRRRSNSQGSELRKQKDRGKLAQVTNNKNPAEDNVPDPPRRSSSLRHALLISRSIDGASSHKDGSPSKK